MTTAPWHPTVRRAQAAHPHRWQLALALWTIPLVALWLHAVLWPASLARLESWLGDPTLGLAAFLVVGSELFALLVVQFQLGSSGISLRRFALPPIAVAALPMLVSLLGLRADALVATEPAALTMRHLFVLGALLYAGFGLLGLRGLLESDPEPLPERVPEAVPARPAAVEA